MNYNTFMSSVPLREDILDDLTYLQKHLRLIIKFHQKLSQKLYINPDSSHASDQLAIRSRNFLIIRKLMDELEEEMADISKEQKMLTDIVKNCMLNHRNALKKSNMDVDPDIANGFITRALQYHYEKNYFQITPSNVKVRMSEEELKEKFNQVKNDCDADRAILKLMQAKKEESLPSASSKHVKRESLLKPHFRKPSSSHVQKKPAAGVKKSILKPVKANTQAITHSRLNLLRALSKVKTEQVDNKEELDKFYSERCRATFAEVGNGDDRYSIRSDEDCSDKSSSYDSMDTGNGSNLLKPRKHKRRSPGENSAESSDSDYMKKYPPMPIESPPKTEYSQEEFLALFKLITPLVAESLKIRRSERKRRNCTKNEKTDYHYGNFDLNEAAYRVRLNNKKSILYSPNVKQRNGKSGRKFC